MRGATEFIGILMTFIFVFIVFPSIIGGYLGHISETKTKRQQYGWTTFRRFIKEFNKCDEWTVKYRMGVFIDYIIFESGFNCYVTDTIIKFNGNYMILDPISYILFKIWRFKRKLQIDKSNKIKW